MKQCYLYEGCFFSSNYLYAIPFIKKQERLFQTIVSPHVTFAYKPDVFHINLYGQPLTVKAIAYGNDGMNEGLKVELVYGSSELTELFRKIETPHITLSIGKHAQAVDTRFLDFTPIAPFEIQGLFGCYTTNGEVVLSQ